MQAIESFSFQNAITDETLINNSGLLIANFISERFIRDSNKITFLLGSGTNGSDGIVAASNLKSQGYDVSLVILRPRSSNDTELMKFKKLYDDHKSPIYDFSDNQIQ